MHSHREKNIKMAAILNISFALVEFFGGLWTHSFAILSDALHDLGDSVTLFISWLFERGAKKTPDHKRTYGYQRLSLFSAIFSAIILVSGSLVIVSQAIPQLFAPTEVDAPGMFGIAILGVIANGLGYYRLHKGASLNEKVLSWHLLEDVFGWIIIMLGSLFIQLWDLPILDPIMTIGYTGVILYNVIKNLGEAFNILLEGVPRHIDVNRVKTVLLDIHGVLAVHDLHIWSLEGETDIFTGHIVVEERLLTAPDQTKRIIKEALQTLHIEHSTIELESRHYCSGIECQFQLSNPRTDVPNMS